MEIAKFSSQLIVALGQATLHLRQALYPLMERARTAAQDLRGAMASLSDAITVASNKFSKNISHFSATLKVAALHLRQALYPLMERARMAAQELRGAMASSIDAAAVASNKFSNNISQLSATLKEAALQFRQALNPLTERGKGALQKLPELLANSLNAGVAVGGKIHEQSSQVVAALKQTPAHLRQAMVPLVAGGRNVLQKTRSLQDARHARENHLRELLASSVDAVVVTNVDRRFVSANPNALHLFGVSDANIRQFTIDAFLLEDQILHLDASGVPLISREETRGECKIRRLTGNLRVAEYVFVPNFVPFRHLFIFRNDREWLRRKRVVAG
jgi:PAS domain S-box-containing protein